MIGAEYSLSDAYLDPALACKAFLVGAALITSIAAAIRSFPGLEVSQCEVAACLTST